MTKLEQMLADRGGLEVFLSRHTAEQLSEMIYQGDNAASMRTAAEEWRTLSSYSYRYVAARLRAGFTWAGIAAGIAKAKIGMYEIWLNLIAMEASKTCQHASSAVRAYERVRAAVVPPHEARAIRMRLEELRQLPDPAALNAAEIADLEAADKEMWAKNVQAIQGYLVTASSESELPPFPEVPNINHSNSSTEQSYASEDSFSEDAFFGDYEDSSSDDDFFEYPYSANDSDWQPQLIIIDPEPFDEEHVVWEAAKGA